MNRSIASDQIYKALAILTISLGWITASTFMFLVWEPTIPFLDGFFISISTFSTVGFKTLSLDSLSTITKCLLMLNMMFGRIGSLTFLLALVHQRKETRILKFPEERVFIA